MPKLSFKSLTNILSIGTKKVDHALIKNGKKLRSKSTKSLSNNKESKKNKITKEAPKLPDDIWNNICDNLSPFDQIKLRRVNKQLHNVVENRLKLNIYLDIVKCDLNDVLPDGEQNDGEFYRHRKHNMLLHIRDRSMAIVVDDKWTTRDAYLLFDAIKFFGKHGKCITMDSPISELVVVGLSSLKISRWHAFECYIQAVGPLIADELHMKPNKAICSNTSKAVFFPRAKEITIRVLTSDLGYLSRISDYHVPSCSMFDYNQLELLRVNVVDNSIQYRNELGSNTKYVKRPFKHICTFKKWVRATELREKYVQQYS